MQRCAQTVSYSVYLYAEACQDRCKSSEPSLPHLGIGLAAKLLSHGRVGLMVARSCAFLINVTRAIRHLCHQKVGYLVGVRVGAGVRAFTDHVKEN